MSRKVTKAYVVQWMNENLPKIGIKQTDWVAVAVRIPRLSRNQYESFDYPRLYIRAERPSTWAIPGVWLIPCYYTMAELSDHVRNGHELFLNSKRGEIELDLRKEAQPAAGV